MANGHLQRDEAAIAIAEHDGLAAAGVLHRLRHPVGDIGKTAADRLRRAKARQFGNDHPERPRQRRDDGVETRAVRQQRMKQEKRRRPLPDCAALTVPPAKSRSMPVSLVRVAKPRFGCAPDGPLDKSKFRLFKPLSLDVIFHDCEIEV